jgi:hypothetical protein
MHVQVDGNAAHERLEEIRIENEVRTRSFDMREKEFETAAREPGAHSLKPALRSMR